MLAHFCYLLKLQWAKIDHLCMPEKAIHERSLKKCSGKFGKNTLMPKSTSANVGGLQYETLLK